MCDKIRILKALSDETRVNIIRILMSKEMCACSIFPLVGKSQPTVSLHLKILENAGIIEQRKEHTNIWYKLKSEEAKKIMYILGFEKFDLKLINRIERC